MRELPKELTAELLGLIYGYKITSMELMPKINDSQRLFFKYLDEDNVECEEAKNIDTLTRLILQYIDKQGYVYNIFNSTSIQGYVMIIDNRKYTGKSIFDVSIKHIDFISKL